MQRSSLFVVTLFVALASLLSGCPKRVETGPTSAPPDSASVAVPSAGAPGGGLVTLPDKVTRQEGWVELDLRQAQAWSAQQGKPMLLYFYTRWCGPCKQLTAKVFTAPEFQQFAPSLVAVRVDAAEGWGAEAAEQYDVHSYPTMVVCKPGGEEIERFFGFSKTADFIATVQDYLAGRNTATDYRDRARAAPDDLLLAFQAGRELAIRKRGKEALPFLGTVWQKDPENTTGQVPRAMLLLAKTVYLDNLHAPELALPVLEELSERFPETYHGTEATYMIARVYLEQKQRDKAALVLTQRARIKPDDAISYFRFATFCLRYNFLLDEARKRLEAGLELHPRHAYLWKTLADVRFRQQDRAGAVEAMEKASALPGASPAYQKLLETYRQALERQQESQ